MSTWQPTQPQANELMYLLLWQHLILSPYTRVKQRHRSWPVEAPGTSVLQFLPGLTLHINEATATKWRKNTVRLVDSEVWSSNWGSDGPDVKDRSSAGLQDSFRCFTQTLCKPLPPFASGREIWVDSSGCTDDSYRAMTTLEFSILELTNSILIQPWTDAIWAIYLCNMPQMWSHNLLVP